MSKLNELMSKVNAWIGKVGIDKITHFAVAAWLVAECKAYGTGAGCIGFLVVVMLSFVKEKWMDDRLTAMDFWWSVCGGFASLVLMVVRDIIG